MYLKRDGIMDDEQLDLEYSRGRQLPKWDYFGRKLRENERIWIRGRPWYPPVFESIVQSGICNRLF